MLRDAAETAEMRDSAAAIEAAARKASQLLLSAQSAMAFTGAGISTSAGIGDYRGRAGKWTQMDREEAGAGAGAGDSDQEASDGVEYDKLRPTYTHEAIVELLRAGRIGSVVSQNGDGLHPLSGLEPGREVFELHGNVFVERCSKCPARYSRPFYTLNDAASQYWEEVTEGEPHTVPMPVGIPQCKTCGLSHGTGRKCDRCGHGLMDTIINFGDDLEEEILTAAQAKADAADLVLVLGTTALVTPACDLVKRGKHPAPLIIVNRQATHLDDFARSTGCVVHCDADRFFQLVFPSVMGAAAADALDAGRAERLVGYDKLRDA